MAHRVFFSPEAQADLQGLYDYIADRSGPDRAIAYIRRIRSYCLGFADFPERGTRRDDLLPGLRVIGFERRITIAFHIKHENVVFDRIAYGGRDLEGLLIG